MPVDIEMPPLRCIKMTVGLIMPKKCTAGVAASTSGRATLTHKYTPRFLFVNVLLVHKH